ncbi:MAG: hypothetical protein HUJ22_03620 [Gracilimonas sp.]|uniref:hypothetical protein n=1 Tax=Gracilimonas sp. TaxID=1974203 RepID=UPI00199BBA5F|nr:hypothetical protein [Gracilimonas sp.]MBD3615638.1 hypothetical protein [Gracilimonas sp.]
MSLLLMLPASIFAQQTSLSILTQKATELGIDESYITRLQERAQVNGISEDQLAEILEPAVTLAEGNLPFDMILEKTSEGLAKRVPNHVLVNVLRGLQEATQHSVQIVDPWMQGQAVQNMLKRTGGSQESAQQFRKDMLKNTGRALNQGLSEQAVTDFMNELNNDEVLSKVDANEIVTSLTILPDLPTSSDNPELSGKLIIRSLKGGFKSADLQKLPSAMQMAQSRGQLPAGNIVNGILQQLEIGAPATNILQGLFDGKIGSPPAGVPGRPGNPIDGNSGSS